MKKKKTPLSHKVVCCQMLDLETSKSNSEVSNQIRGKLLLSQNTTLLQREPFPHNVLYYQPLPITSYKERFDDNNYFE